MTTIQDLSKKLREEWVNIAIEGAPTTYEVSNLGRVRNKKGTIMKNEISKNGYLRTSIRFKKKGRTFLVHRLVLCGFKGFDKNKKQCAHLDGDKRNNKLENLIWVNQKENELHKKIHGRNPFGERNPKAVLKEKQVLEILKNYDGKFLTRRKMAKQYGVSVLTIARVVLRQSWKHLEEALKRADEIGKGKDGN